MQLLKEKLNNYQPPKPTKKFNHLWETQAEEVSQYFGKPLYWLFHRYERFKIMDAYRVCKEKNIKALNYLIGILKQ